MTQMGLEFEVVPSQFAEKLDDSRSPEEVAKELALGKALAVAEQFPDSLVIGSDTIITIDGKQLEKPHDNEEAVAMLKLLSGKTHAVTTSIAVVRLADSTQLVNADTAYVHFLPYDEAKVRAYVQTGDSLDKAGGYGIQSGAAPLIDHIEGHYDTVVGLPTHKLAELLARVGINAKPVELIPPVKQVRN